ncbi:U1 snRNP splicing complex subunit (Luc7) [Pyrenophora seminiperda CCB06]|uniref:U1 snRNP splicing complex subunit (Luc7) n=1 Tax=Pyrenophora seminiperda CCB06 TaxID=1302712 RepID=A0A3M7M5U3_9PLEO|nr:U1 snRNP splicing complex subunit (Luc7) [Pyrenophora seminiperda CCB06]
MTDPKTYKQQAGEYYNQKYETWMPWIEDQYLKWFTKDNKASYATKQNLDKTKVTGVDQIDNLQDGVNNLVGGQVGKGGLAQPIGDAVSKEGINRAERGGKDEQGRPIEGQGPLGGYGQSAADGVKGGASSVAEGAKSAGGWAGGMLVLLQSKSIFTLPTYISINTAFALEDNASASADKTLTAAQLAQRAKKREKAHARRKEKKLQQTEGFGSWAYAPKTRWSNVEFELPEFPAAQRLYIGSKQKWETVDFTTCTDIKVVEFGCDFDVGDEHLNALANAPEEFRMGLLAIYAGGPQTSSCLSFTDSTLREIMDKAAFPNLEHIHLLGCAEAITNGLMGIIGECRQIKSIVATTHNQGLYLSNMVFLMMLQKAKTLRYFELAGFFLDDESVMNGLIGTPAKAIPGLEMVVKPAGHPAKIYRKNQAVLAEPSVKV